jgi:hypothetical protein
MSDAKREMLFSPPSTNSMQITCANTTGLDLNIDIKVTKWLGGKLIQMELRPFLRVLNLEAFERIWVHHCRSIFFFRVWMLKIRRFD